MPRDARARFDRNCADIERLLDLDASITGDPARRHQRSVLNRSAIVLLCAFWEAYCEDVVADGVEHLLVHASDHTALPKFLQKQLASELKSDTHELAVWRLAGDGWRQELTKRTAALQDARNRRLNTPKTTQVVELFRDGIGLEDISKHWVWQDMKTVDVPGQLDTFVTLRGAIAHRGRVSGVKREHVIEWLSFIRKLVTLTGAAVNVHVRDVTGHAMWWPGVSDARKPAP
jgi:hypothetical protein